MFVNLIDPSCISMSSQNRFIISLRSSVRMESHRSAMSFEIGYIHSAISPASAPNIFILPIVFLFDAKLINKSQSYRSHSCNLHFSISKSNVLAVLKKQSSISLRYSSKFGICGTNKKFFLICIATSSESVMP